MRDIPAEIRKKRAELEELKVLEERLMRWGNRAIKTGTCFFSKRDNKYCCVCSYSDASDCVSRYGFLWATTDEDYTGAGNAIGEGEITEGSILENGDPIDFETFDAHYQYAQNALNNLRLKIKFG